METSIVYFHQSFYIPAIQEIAFNLTHVPVLGTHHCGNTCREAFKRRASYQYLLCHKYYSELVVTIFEHQIQSEYYGGNQSISIEGISL